MSISAVSTSMPMKPPEASVLKPPEVKFDGDDRTPPLASTAGAGRPAPGPGNTYRPARVRPRSPPSGWIGQRAKLRGFFVNGAIMATPWRAVARSGSA